MIRPHRRTRQRHGLRHRRVAGLVALVAFLCGWTIDVGALHDCPHHELGHGHGHGHAPGQVDGHSDGHDGHGHHDHAGHHGEAPGAAAADADAPSHHHGHEGPCTCRSDCTGASAASVASPHPVRSAPAPATPGPIPAAPADLRPNRAAVHHVLHWPTAPPLQG